MAIVDEQQLEIFRLRAINEELLEACKDCADVMQAAASMGDDVDQAWLERRIKRFRAAIAKAEGK